MKRVAGVLLSIAVLSIWTPAQAWWGKGHEILTRAAVRALPQEMPPFFREGEGVAANVVYDADLFKNRATPHLDNAEHGEHFIDLELLEGRGIPEKRYAFFDTCTAVGRSPSQIGTLPYAVAEWTERLAIAFAEHRKWPDDLPIQQKCLVYAGFIAHYAQDACQPLHVTVDFNGRKMADGTVVGKGIHEKVDGLVEKIGFDPEELAKKQKLRNFVELMPGILGQIDESFTHVDRVYEMEAEMGEIELRQVRAFAEDRARAAVNFTASLYLTAWKLSEEVKLPSWHER